MGNCVHTLNIEKAREARKFTLDQMSFVGLCTECHDGDTIKCAMKYIDNKYYVFDIRLTGIDAPELHPDKNLSKEDKKNIIDCANSSKNFLEMMILNKQIKITIDKTKDKYGRILATVFCDNININLAMLNNNKCIPYFGGTKNLKNGV